VVIGADMAGSAEIGQGLELVQSLPEVKNLPAGVRVQETGDAEIMGEVFAGFRDAMITGLMLVLVVLILLFGSVFHSFTILGSLPLSIGGVVAGLWLTNSAVSMPVVIGILMLMGIVTKNAIMLVDFAIEEVKQGVGRADAIIDAGRKRARPIVMTTIAMSAGMVPAALALGDGGEFRAPMAIAVIGGLLVSTFLSLVFVPSLYTIMDDAAIGTARLFRWLFRPNPTDDPLDDRPALASNVHALERAAGRQLPIAAE
jgi:multidrug efflux pump subunit AcrB